jgi:hypothetical protein
MTIAELRALAAHHVAEGRVRELQFHDGLAAWHRDQAQKLTDLADAFQSLASLIRIPTQKSK